MGVERVPKSVRRKAGARRGLRQGYAGPVKKRQSRNASDGNTLSSRTQQVHRGARGGESERPVRLRIVCKAPPDPDHHGAIFGLQDNSSTAQWSLHAGSRKPNGDFVFDCEARVRPKARTGDPNFLGDFVHGKPDERFLYLSWRPKDCLPVPPAMGSPRWQRRMKIHLSTITRELLEEAMQSGGVLEATVEGTGKDGGPNCASVPLLGGGWTVRMPKPGTRHGD